MDALVAWNQIPLSVKMAVGARDVRLFPDMLAFRAGRGWWIRITLDPSDTYLVEKVTSRLEVKDRRENVYCDVLGDVILRLMGETR